MRFSRKNLGVERRREWPSRAGRWLIVVFTGVAAWVGNAPLAEGDEPARWLGPAALAISPDGKTLYVAGADARQVLWVQTAYGVVVRRVEVPAPPAGLAVTPEGSRLIVVCSAPQSVIEVRAADSGQLLHTLAAGHTATAPVVSPDGNRLYVCNRFQNDVSVIDLEARKEIARVPVVREPVAAAITPEGQALVVANHLPLARTDDPYGGEVCAAVTVIDTRSLRAEHVALPHGSNGLRGIRIAPDGRHAVVTHLLSNFQKVPFRVDMGWINTNVVSILDVPGRRLVSTIGMDEQDLGAANPWDIVWSADGRTVWVSLSGTHELCTLSSEEFFSSDARRTMSPMMGVWPIYPTLGTSMWRRIALPGNGPRAMVAAGPRVYVAEYFSDTVAVVDQAGTEAGRVSTIRLGPPPQLTPQRRGAMLFHDATLCYQHWQSCASCHPEGRADGLNWDLMNDGVGNPKNTKSLVWSHRTPPAMAEGVRMSAEEAVRSGIRHILFAERPEEEAAAMDAYLKALEPVPSPRLVNGQLSRAAQRGRRLFYSGRLGCASCHPAPLYTDLRPHNVGSRGLADANDGFDTPTLVELWRTAPYLHDGRYLTLHELFREGKHGLHRPDQHLTDQELDDLVEFLLSL